MTAQQDHAVKRGHFPVMSADQMIATLKGLADAQAVQKMARLGINPGQALGISLPILRKLARANGKDQALAVALWDSGIHEARILASLVAEPHLVSPHLMDRWANEFASWDVCDQVCGNLFDQTPFAYHKAVQWCHEEQEFVRRAGFVMMAELAVHDKEASDEAFLPFFRSSSSMRGMKESMSKKPSTGPYGRWVSGTSICVLSPWNAPTSLRAWTLQPPDG
jgi:3-methyladenine DNA glycosylase AlkD